MQITKVELIPPTLYQESLCNAFADAVYFSNKSTYDKRKQTNELKVKADIYIGKMAEFAVYNFLVEKDRVVTQPDIMIYSVKRKSFDADLFVDEKTPIHVKSCMSVRDRENSWVFQPTDKLVCLPSADDIIALVVISDLKDFSAYLVKAIDVMGLYGPPRIEGLDKKVLYEEILNKEL